MAAPEEQGVSPFPDPPTLFYKLYTDKNCQSGQAPPPPLPAKGSYTSFGCAFDVSTPHTHYKISDILALVLKESVIFYCVDSGSTDSFT